MKQRAQKILGWLLVCGTLSAGRVGNAHAADIVVAMSAGTEGQTLQVPVSSLNATSVIAAAFTVTYDTNALVVDAVTDFFGDFATQFAASGVLGPTATNVVVDGVTNIRPFLVSARSNGVAIAGVRRLAAEPLTNILFTLLVSLRPGASNGVYTINLEPTVVRLAAAGYDPGGETLDLLIGRDRLADTYPVLLAASGSAAHLLPGHASFSPTDPDTDDDGIPDAWELLNFTNLIAAGIGSDFDGDGFLDILECFMGADPKIAQTEFVIRGDLVGGSFKLYFPMRTDHGLNFDTQWSTDLTAWSGAGITLAPRPDLGSGPDWAMQEAGIPTDGAPQMFLRLRILP